MWGPLKSGAALALLATLISGDFRRDAAPDASAVGLRVPDSASRMDAPLPAPAFIASNPVQVRPALQDGLGGPTTRFPEAIVAETQSSGPENSSDLIAASILKKYLSFRLSLTSP